MSTGCAPHGVVLWESHLRFWGCGGYRWRGFPNILLAGNLFQSVDTMVNLYYNIPMFREFALNILEC